jgi:hypothetical protein
MIAEQTTYSTQHGSPYDRGSADSYYGRSFDPHYWPQGTYNGARVELAQMTAEEITAYSAGYTHNELFGDKKSWD